MVATWRVSVLLGLLGALVTPAAGQGPLRVDEVSGHVRIQYDGLSTDYSGSSRAGRTGVLERLRVRVLGALYDPDFLAFDVGVEPYARQLRYGGSTSADNRGRTRGVNGHFSFQLLSQRPVSLVLVGNRGDTWFRDSFGVESNAHQRRLGSTVSYRNVLLPLVLDYEAVDLERWWTRGADDVDAQDYRTRRLRLTGNNSKLGLQAQHFTYRDPSRGLDLIDRDGQLSHRFGWGKGSSLASTVTYTDRHQNAARFWTLRWLQAVRLQHTQRVGSDFSYSLSRGGVLGRDTRGYRASAMTSVVVVRGLEAGVSGSWDETDHGTTGVRRVRLGPRIAFRRDFPGGLQVSTTVSGGGLWQRHTLPSTGMVHVVDELYTVPETGIFRIRQPHVDPWSVAISSADGTQYYRDLLDYLLVKEEPFLEIQALPRSRFAPGDTVRVSYRYALRAEYDARFASLTGDISLGGISIFHHRYLRAGERAELDGSRYSLANMDEMSTGAMGSLARSWGTVQATVRHRRLRSDFGDFSTLGGRAEYRFSLGGHGGGTVAGTLTRTEGEGRSSRSRGVGAGAEWTVRPNFNVFGNVNLAEWTADSRESTSFGAGAGLRWSLGETRVTARFDHYRWDNPMAVGDPRNLVLQDRLLITATRTF